MAKNLEKPLYCYVRKGNYRHAKTYGKRTFGSHSAYVDALISLDRNVKPALGTWKTKGENKKLRKKKC